MQHKDCLGRRNILADKEQEQLQSWHVCEIFPKQWTHCGSLKQHKHSDSTGWPKIRFINLCTCTCQTSPRVALLLWLASLSCFYGYRCVARQITARTRPRCAPSVQQLAGGVSESAKSHTQGSNTYKNMWMQLHGIFFLLTLTWQKKNAGKTIKCKHYK